MLASPGHLLFLEEQGTPQSINSAVLVSSERHNFLHTTCPHEVFITLQQLVADLTQELPSEFQLPHFPGDELLMCTNGNISGDFSRTTPFA